jgi:hypothetical protein
MSSDAPIPVVLCRPYLVDLSAFAEKLSAFGDVREAVADLSPEPIPTYERMAQQQFLECLDAISWRNHSDAHQAARALFDRLFWSWRSEDLRIVQLPTTPFALDLAWDEKTVHLFAELWQQLSPVLDDLREPFDHARSEGELAGRFEDFVSYAHAWGGILERGADEEQGLIVVQFESTTDRL